MTHPRHVVGIGLGGAAAGWLALERPDLVASLTMVSAPPQGSEVLRAHLRGRVPEALLEEDAFPERSLRLYRGRALVVEAGEDPLYSPTSTLFWRMFLPYATFARADASALQLRNGAPLRWLCERLEAHLSGRPLEE